MDIFGLIVIIAAIGLYFLPTIIGWNKRNSFSILLLNFFLGWTFIGWVVALVWATTNDAQPVVVQQKVSTPKPASNADELEKLASLKDRGIITPEEFEQQKARVLTT